MVRLVLGVLQGSQLGADGSAAFLEVYVEGPGCGHDVQDQWLPSTSAPVSVGEEASVWLGYAPTTPLVVLWFYV